MNGQWKDIASAPEGETFIVAAWCHDAGKWIVGEAERDPDDKQLIWWASQRGDYSTDHLAASGMTPLYWQPLPSTTGLVPPPGSDK